MDNTLKYNRRRSGYEPSDTETDWHDSPGRDERQPDEHIVFDQTMKKSPINSVGRMTPVLEREAQIFVPTRRRHGTGLPPPHNSDMRRNVSPLLHRTYSDRNLSPFPARLERRTNGDGNGNGNSGNICQFSKSERRINRDKDGENVSPFTISESRRRVSTAGGNHDFESSYRRRTESAPRTRLGGREQKKVNRTLSPLPQGNSEVFHNKPFPSVGEINEMVANAKISRGLNGFESTDSISPGDIFFSKNYVVFPKNSGANKTSYLPKPPGYVDSSQKLGNKVNGSLTRNSRGTSKTSNSSSVISRVSSNMSESSGRTSASTRKFVENRRKSQTEASWFFCITKGSCKTSDKSPEKGRPFDEASFIEKAVVVESLRPFWADKHQPASLIGFKCHKQEAIILQQLANSKVFPSILLKGAPGSGKKALIMAFLREIYGDPVWNISHDLRYFHILESRPMEVIVPVSSSPHHIELNVYSEPKAAYALTSLVKQISSEYALAPEFSTANAKADYKVLVLYDVDKAAENIQHLIKWIMDCYSDSCKLILCCEDDVDIFESVKTRCKVIKVEAPVTHEIMEVLIQIAKKEGFELPMSFAAKIATNSKQNLRRAIMGLEACKAHNYPFVEDQPIPLGWEETASELAIDILADPSHKRLFIFRAKIQKLLADFVHPKLILLKLVEQFLQRVEVSLKRELYYWYAYYDKRLPSGTSALLKLEEFVAKFMSIYRKSSTNRQFL